MNDNNYSEQSIIVLEGIEAVRKRPAMYIGSTDINGVYQIINEVIDNAIDEALAGFCDKIDIRILFLYLTIYKKSFAPCALALLRSYNVLTSVINSNASIVSPALISS